MQVKWNKIIEEINTSSQAYLLGVSGGVDSVFMLRFVAKNASVPFRVAHFNHGLRRQAEEEERLVRGLCDELAVVCLVGYGDVDAMRESPSLEAEARRQRYGFFESVIQPGEAVMTGHHANDQLETIILRLMRGYPHDNLRIRKFSGNRYRPFLDVPKQVIVEQSKRRGYRWLEDASNADPAHERNWVRNELIPMMEMRRNVLRTMVHTSANPVCGETDDCGEEIGVSLRGTTPFPRPK